MMEYNTRIVLAGTCLLGACSGMVGSFAVLRRRALMGDALAHAALPGLCLAFLVVGERHLPAMLLGAFLTGILGIAVVTGLRFSTRVKEDAAIGIVLSVFYGAGIALSRLIQNQTTGGSKAGLNSYILGQTSDMIRQEVYLIGTVALFCLLLVLLFYKEFKLVAFDPEFAEVQGWPSFRLDLMLMAMIAVTVVIGLPAVGVVLMAAMLITPAAAARFWTQQLGLMLLLSALMGVIIGAVGTLVTAQYRFSAGPTIVLVGTVIFLFSLFFAPRRGVISRLISEFAFQRKVRRQAMLKLFYEWNEPALPARRPISLDEISDGKAWSRNTLDRSLRRLQNEGLIASDSSGRFSLTQQGLIEAAETVRVDRLWDLFLDEHAEAAVNFADLDRKALEEKVPARMIAQLENRLREMGRLPEIPIADRKGEPV